MGLFRSPFLELRNKFISSKNNFFIRVIHSVYAIIAKSCLVYFGTSILLNCLLHWCLSLLICTPCAVYIFLNRSLPQVNSLYLTPS
uniref:Uncharacterized protein n=1 Tax=Castor canadensis TaxID=51338 RepID=A0A8C0X3E7_CASCN